MWSRWGACRIAAAVRLMLASWPLHSRPRMRSIWPGAAICGCPVASASGASGPSAGAALAGDEGSVLLLDEPTSMLDPAHQHSILQAVRRFAEQGGAALVILHDLNLAARYCDRLLLLKNGRAQIAGAPDEVLREAPLQAVFGLDVLVQRHPERGHPLVIAR